MDGTLTLEKSGAQIIDHNHNSLLTIQSTGNTKIESVTFNAGAISTVTTLDMSGALDMSGTLTLKNSGAQTIDHNHNSLLTIQSDGNTKIESVVFNAGAISTVTTLDMSGALTGLTTLTASGDTKTTGGFLVTNTRGIKGDTGTNVVITASGTNCAGHSSSGVTLTSWHGTIRNSNACSLGYRAVSNSALMTMQTNHRVGVGLSSYSGGTVVASMCTGGNNADTGSSLSVAESGLILTIFQREFTPSDARFRFSVFNPGAAFYSSVYIKICYIVIFSAS
jgi:hypothetical protein